MAVTKTNKGFPSVVVSPTYGAYAGVSKTATEIHLCKEEKKIFVDGDLFASEKSCLCGSDTASTGGWYKLGRLECNSDDQVNVNVICSIMETYNSAYSGLFVLQARHDKSGSWSIKKLQWLARIGFSATAVKCVIDGNKAYLYAYKTTTQYSRLFVKVLCESNWKTRVPHLFLADNSTPETSTPGGTTIAECCAPTATKLQTARNISLGGALWGAAIPFNGSSDISILGALKHVVSSNDNQCNYPYRRFCSFGSKASPITGNYNDIHATFLIFRPDTPYRCGLLRIYLRTNDANSVSTTSAQWSFCGDTTKPPIHCAIRNENGATYADYFIQHSSTYECYHIYLIAQSTARANANGNISNNIIKLYGPYEARNTTATDKLTSSEAYLTIEEAATILHAQAYSKVTTAGMGGYVIESYRSQYIRQTAASATAERRVLLGENHDTTQYDKVYKSSKLLFNPATGALTATTFIGSLNGNASSATTATKVSQVLRIKDAGSSGDGITYNGSSEFGITVPTEMVGSLTGGGLLLKVPSKAAIGLGNVDNTADANKSVKFATSATTATNLASAPVIAAGTTSTNAITVTAGGKKSAEFTVPYATKAGSATSATSATKVSNALTFDLAGQLPYDGSTPLTVVVPTDMIATASSGGFTFKRASNTFCAIVNTVVSATPFWKIKLTSYSDNFNGHAPQNGDTLFLWVKNTIAASTTAYPFCIPYSTAGESDNSKCIPLYHGQNTGTPKEWLGSTALSAGFYMFVFRSDVRGTSTAITTSGGWVFLYLNVSTT